ncbi:MAG: ABC transporter ATP-binding protein [Spirochaetales bacterium]|nr:ABC transporter ATP-binding protein [Leptospiraceae bacterium]MCP5480492.1 ABC transporter ATP-binding protein [Spirochaetales bacterium]
MPDQALSIRNLMFAYGESDPVLDIESLDVARGERVFLHGPSGSGKTTLLGLIAGVLSGYRGQIQILERDLASLSGAEKDHFRGSHMGYIFQMFNLIPYLSVMENIVLPCRLNPARRDRLGQKAAEDAAREIATHLEIGELIEKRVTSLSVGQQQRVAAARALIGAPEIVIADEPTSALDQDRRERFLRLLFENCQRDGSTVLFVSHDRTLGRLFDREISLPEANRATQAGAA